MLGIDVNDTKEVKIKDATFTVGILPYKTRLRLMSLAMEYANISREELEKQASENTEKYFLQEIEFVKYGVKNHKNIVNRKGKQIDCKKNNDGSLSDETLNLYLASNIIPELFSHVFQFNTLTEDEGKN